MQAIYEIMEMIKRIMKEDNDRILNIRGGKGYSVGHPYPTEPGKKVNQDLGNPGPYEPDEEDENEFNPVKISKAFKKD